MLHVAIPFHDLMNDGVPDREEAFAMNRDQKRAELAILKARVEVLERELDYPTDLPTVTWVKETARDYFVSPLFLGLVAAATSLAINIIGAALAGKNIFELLRIYLTLPLGERALGLVSGEDDFVLFAGTCLYFATGTLGGVPVYYLLRRFNNHAALPVRCFVATVIGLAIWLINYYGILAWLQPFVMNGNWIVRMIPWYVAAVTHVVFVWTIFALDHWGRQESDEPMIMNPGEGQPTPA